MLRFLKSRKKREQEQSEKERLFREKYEAFMTILAENEHALELMTELEKKYYSSELTSIPYLKNVIKNLSKSIRYVVDSLVQLSDGRYREVVDAFERIEAEIRQIITGKREPLYTPIIIPMDQLSKEFVDKAGTKMANLGELRNRIGVRVPDGFAVTACAYQQFLDYNFLTPKAAKILEKVDIENNQDLIRAEKELKKLVFEAEIPPEISYLIEKRSREMEERAGRKLFWAVRSSAIGEDLENSFAGQFSSTLNVPTDGLLNGYKEVIASKYNARAIVYRKIKNIRDDDISMSVGIIEMIHPLCSGVLYTTDPVNPDRKEIIINAVWGLGQLLVDGVISADIFVLDRSNGLRIKRKEVAEKQVCLVECTEGGTDHEEVPADKCKEPCLTDEQILELAEVAIKVENHFSCPQDIEWAFDRDKKLYLLQARPLHVVKRKKVEDQAYSIDAPVIFDRGEPVSAGVAVGKVFKLNDLHELTSMPRGSILVARNSSPRLVKAVGKASAILAERGNTTDHMASVVREFKIPCIVKIPSLFSTLKNGQEITVDASRGIIYDGSFPELIREETELKETWVDVKSTESYQLLRRLSKLIIPLHLTDPRDANFKPQCCQTWHDILRFCHETALNEMFLLTEKEEIRKIKRVYRVKTSLPFQLYVLDLFGDTVVTDARKTIKPEMVKSVPFQALWRGMASPEVPWSGPPVSMGMKDLLGAMSRTDSLENVPKDTRSLAVVTHDYLNLSLSMGFHYVILDAYLSNNPFNNYISFSFKGGAAELKKRELRVAMIARILQRLGFQVKKTKDFLKARIKADSAEALSEKLNVIGRMLGVTRLLDIALCSEKTVEKYVEKFFRQEDFFGPAQEEKSSKLCA